MPQHITVVQYNPLWSEMFDREKSLIKKILCDNAVEIYHIGSTSVHGLSAKPIIDIMPIVKNLDEVDSAANSFTDIGYEYLGEFGIVGRRYLRKGGDERTHQIHIFQADDQINIKRHLAVRDYLRAHIDEAQRYAQLKTLLAHRFPYDIDGYCNGKEKFMRQLEHSAIAWYDNTIRQPDLCDINEIMEIWKAENIRTHHFIPPNYWEQNYAFVKHELPKSEIYLYVDGGKPIGFLGLNNNYIEGLFVKTDRQHEGIGSKLLNRAKTLKSTLTLHVYKQNTHAIAFYLKNGFRLIGERIDENTNEGEYAMQWKR